MALLHQRSAIFSFALCLALLFFCTGCGPERVDGPDAVSVSVMADGGSQEVNLVAGSTVENALDSANIVLSQTDRVDPPLYSVLNGGEIIVVIRVQEEFETRQEIVPFERQELQNESLPAGETRLVQAGMNGLREVTIRHVLENGIEVSSSVVAETLLQTAVPEIVMVGVQSPFAPIVISGKMVYLTGGNAWVMEDSTAVRRPLLASADLDGRVFALSPDGKWLLFSRASEKPAEEEINTLWVIRTDQQGVQPIDLGVSNVVHFADWRPGDSYTIFFSTVEPRSTAPGWQANNDLYSQSFQGEAPHQPVEILETNPGGIYGWWGMDFSWSSDGSRLAYSRPDSIGVVDIENGSLEEILAITPFNTFADWAWSPGLMWAPDNRGLYFVDHAPPSGLSTAEESTNFDLRYYSFLDTASSRLVQDTGMFAYPSTSALQLSDAGLSYQTAYLQAAAPSQSASSRYRLMLLSAENTGPVLLFPREGVNGMEPQQVRWSPLPAETRRQLIALIYAGNLWILDATSGETQQITGDGLTIRIDWK
jgi:Tol biopolymer transport system component